MSLPNRVSHIHKHIQGTSIIRLLDRIIIEYSIENNWTVRS